MALPTAANAQLRCGPRDKVVKSLAQKYKETQRFVGLAQNGSFMLEVFVSEDGKTFTVTTTSPQGVTCLRAGGINWQAVPPKASGISH